MTQYRQPFGNRRAAARAFARRLASELEVRFDLPAVTDVRGYGLLAAFDLAADGAPGARGYRCLKRLFDEGLLIKWTGDTGIVAPPLIAEPEHIDEIARLLRRVLAAL